MTDTTRTLIERSKSDPSGTYQTWFLWPKRLKNFRSIRRGIGAVVEEIHAGTFGNAYRGSSLETVVASVAEQRQIFKGADHAFLWKPKLRIPDIYENADNQRAFARLLHTCNCCDTEAEMLTAIQRLSGVGIKGLGPAVANLLYFIHPTLLPPFNTAIVNGYNALTGAAVKLGKWDHYLAMRDRILALNHRYRDVLSNDLGALAGLLFDVGTGRYPAPPCNDLPGEVSAWEDDLAKVREQASALAKQIQADKLEDATHTEVQGWLRDLGKSLGYAVWIATNDRGREYNGEPLSLGCLSALPATLLVSGGETVPLIDAVWLDPATLEVAAAFEVEHSTSIYSGIVRLLDLALGTSQSATKHLFLVAPDNREAEVRAQLSRPAFSRVAELNMRYVPYSSLREHRENIARFGMGIKPIEAIAKSL
ncbi:type II restriction endonuclease [Cupriavidus pauculus]|uniref:type II restriction endonuclease n=1 Tax=Cupriavidus pauculus TaxID=82633 RepID=UPI0030FC5976